MPREIPWSPDAEMGVLSCMLMSEDAQIKAFEELTKEDFYEHRNKVVFNAISSIYTRGGGIDVVTISEQLKREGTLERIGGHGYLANLLDAADSHKMVEEYAKIVRGYAILRSIIQETQEIKDKAYETSPDEVPEFVDEAEKRIFNVSSNIKRDGLRNVQDILIKTFDEIDARQNSDKKITGIHTGFNKIDSLTAGLQKSDLIIVAGRPAMGKTSLALDFARTAATGYDIPTAFFSLEMSETQLVERMLCAQGKVDSRKLRVGDLNDNEINRLKMAAREINESPIYIDDTPALTPLQLRGKARRIKKESGLGLIIVDYLQLMGDDDRTRNRREQIGKISRSLKIVAKELEVPVVALSQLSRAPEHRDDHRPILSDLRESGDIEQDADVVMFVYRGEVYYGPQKDGEDLRNKAEILVSKQRNGPTGKVTMRFLKEYTTFED